jgi:hypothetical protein
MKEEWVEQRSNEGTKTKNPQATASAFIRIIGGKTRKEKFGLTRTFALPGFKWRIRALPWIVF